MDSERRKRQHLKNQVKWYDRRESKHLRSAYNVRIRVHQPMFGKRHNALLLLSKPPQRRQSGAVAHDFGSLHRKRKSPGGISEAMRYGIVSPLGLRPEAQRQCRQSPTAVPLTTQNYNSYSTPQKTHKPLRIIGIIRLKCLKDGSGQR